MTNGQEFSLASAQLAADEGRLAEWVVDFLASPGSDNAPLAAALAFSGTTFFGPIRFKLDQLTPMAGPPRFVPLLLKRTQGFVDGLASLGGVGGNGRRHQITIFGSLP